MGKWRITRDGFLKAIHDTEQQAWAWMHRDGAPGSSISHAVQHEGWAIHEPLEDPLADEQLGYALEAASGLLTELTVCSTAGAVDELLTRYALPDGVWPPIVVVAMNRQRVHTMGAAPGGLAPTRLEVADVQPGWQIMPGMTVANVPEERLASTLRALARGISGRISEIRWPRGTITTPEAPPADDGTRSTAPIAWATVPPGFAATVWKGAGDVADALSVRHAETGATVFRVALALEDVRLLARGGDLFLVMRGPVPPWFVTAAEIEALEAAAQPA